MYTTVIKDQEKRERDKKRVRTSVRVSDSNPPDAYVSAYGQGSANCLKAHHSRMTGPDLLMPSNRPGFVMATLSIIRGGSLRVSRLEVA